MRTPLFRLFVVLLFILVVVLVAWFVRMQPAVNPDPNHTHADFAVWIDGTQWDFSQQKYMSGSGHDLSEYFHLHDGNGSVLHMHKPGLPISQFFTSIGWTMSNTCMKTDTGKQYCDAGGDNRWRMFVDSKEQLMNPYFSFKDTDKILFTYGSSQDVIADEIDKLTNNACLYSKTCPWRGPAPTESCISDPAVPCRE